MSIFKPTKEEQFGYAITFAAHALVIIFMLLMYTNRVEQQRTAFMEITLGEFSDGTMAEFSREEQQEVATDPNPSDVETDQPTPEQVEVTDTPTPEASDPTKDVDLAEQTQDIASEVVVTPDTDEIDPRKLTEEVREQEEEAVRDRTREAETVQEGARESGDIRGIRGRVDADQGTGQSADRTSPYQLEWEGDFERAPVTQPMPSYNVEVEAIISVRFEVRPDGTVGRMTPIIKANPELEREVFRTLRSWRFSRLPSGVPQESQWGTITFRFVLD